MVLKVMPPLRSRAGVGENHAWGMILWVPLLQWQLNAEHCWLHLHIGQGTQVGGP